MDVSLVAETVSNAALATVSERASLQVLKKIRDIEQRTASALLDALP